SNVISGDMPICHAQDALAPADNQLLLDVRTAAEVQAGTIAGAVNIPVDDLRNRLNELPKDKELLAFCQVGLRGYLATRILLQNGFNCRNLSGGYKTFSAVRSIAEPENLPRNKMNTENKQHHETKETPAAEVVKDVDACGLQCPGPIMRLAEAVNAIDRGQSVRVAATDAGFASDVKGWCESTGNELAGMKAEGGKYVVTVVKGATCPVAMGKGADSKKKTIVVFSGDFDKAMAAFIIANGAAAMGSEVTLFFTFWGLNILRRAEHVSVEKNLIEKMFGWMMPRGATKLKLSKMNMAGMGTQMMQGIMKKKNVLSLPELIETAKQNGVRLVGCTMTMDLMGIRREELIDGVEEGGVAMYEAAGVNLFI
ncbi:MAG: DsrE/DsrF/DrsH-like family protein, partial [Planctomycetota bacterium]